MPCRHVRRDALCILSVYRMKWRVPRKGQRAHLRISEEGPEDLVGCQQKAGILRQQERLQSCLQIPCTLPASASQTKEKLGSAQAL